MVCPDCNEHLPETKRIDDIEVGTGKNRKLMVTKIIYFCFICNRFFYSILGRSPIDEIVER